MEVKKNSWGKKIGGLMIVVVPIVISLFAYFEAKKSNEIAQNALTISQTNFEREKRPYITFSPVRFSETEKYIKLEKRDGLLIVKFQFEIKNKGQLPASGLHLPNQTQISGDFSNLKSIEINKQLGSVDLAADETFFIVIELGLGGLSEKEIAENFSNLEKDTLEFPLTFPILYKVSPESDLEYKTTTRMTIKSNQAMIHEIKID